MQGLQELYEERESDGFVVMDVLVQDAAGASPTVEDAATWKEALELTYPVLADVDGSFFSTWCRGQDVFVFYVIDRDGVITWSAQQEGADTLESIRSEVEALLGD